jgi:hypothetical protein
MIHEKDDGLKFIKKMSHRRGTYRSGSSSHTVHGGDNTYLGSILDQSIFRGLSICTRFWDKVPLFLASNFNIPSGMGRTKYSSFCDRRGRSCKKRYITLWHNTDPKKRKDNTSIFGMYLQEIQENITERWRISPEVVKENEGIENFKEYRHNIWI